MSGSSRSPLTLVVAKPSVGAHQTTPAFQACRREDAPAPRRVDGDHRKTAMGRTLLNVRMVLAIAPPPPFVLASLVCVRTHFAAAQITVALPRSVSPLRPVSTTRPSRHSSLRAVRARGEDICPPTK